MPIHGIGAADETFDGKNLKIGIVHARWNKKIIDNLVEGAVEQILEMGVLRENIQIMTVPGAFELPHGVRLFQKAHNFDAVIAIGTLIKGETMHFEYICESVTHELMRMQQELNKPVIYGVLTCLTDEQAKKRATKYPDFNNHGIGWGAAAVEMAIKSQRGH